ncbi:MAG: type II secretion system F family protein [Acidimicrobiales bacterium]
MVWLTLLCGLAVASGLWLSVGALRRPPPSLASPAAAPRVGVSVAYSRGAPPEAVGRLTNRGTFQQDLLVGAGNRSFYRDLSTDLRIVDYSVEYVIYRQIVTTLVGLIGPLVFMIVIMPMAGMTVPPLVALSLCIAFGAVGFYLPLQTLRQDALSRRQEFAAALSHYVSFVDVMVSGGNSIDSSFEFAAELGDGWVWDELRFAISSASSATLAPYRALQDLGGELGVVELSNLARRLEQTQSTGAAIGPALRSLADSLAKDQAREVKVADDVVTEKMTFPLMIVLSSLLTFFGIAAVTAILRAAQGL